MNMVTIAEIKRFNATAGCFDGDCEKDCLPVGMTTDELLESIGSPYNDGDSPFHVMQDPDSDIDGYCPEWSYKDPSKLQGEYIDEETGFTLSDEVDSVSRLPDEPLPYDNDIISCDDSHFDDDCPLPYDDTRL